MSKRTGPTNIVLRKTADKLMREYRKTGSGLWRDVAEFLTRPTRKRISVNLSKINRYSEDGDIIVVPGKVLGSGSLDKKIKIAAFGFSEKAIEKIEASGSTYVTIDKLLDEGVKPSEVKLIV